jgi:hypothetical protein
VPEAFPPHSSTSEARPRFSTSANKVLHAGRRGRSSWAVAGHSDAVMERGEAWRLTALTLQFEWCAGNRQPAARAAGRGEA